MNTQITQELLEKWNVSGNGKFVGSMSADEIEEAAGKWATKIFIERTRSYGDEMKWQPYTRSDVEFQNPVSGVWQSGWSLREQFGLESLEGINRRQTMAGYLDPSGDYGRRSRNVLDTPLFILTSLEDTWKRGTYSNLVGYRTMKRILKDLQAVAPEWVAMVEEKVAKLVQEDKDRKAAAAQSRATAAIEELEKAIQKVKDLGVWNDELAAKVKALAS